MFQQFSLLLASEWVEEARLRRASPAALEAVTTSVSWLIEGRNLTAEVTDEPIFSWLCQFGLGVSALLHARSEKVLLPFAHQHLEIALVRDGDRVRCWIYQTKAPWRVLAGDVLLSLVEQVRQTLLAFARVMEELRGLESRGAREMLGRLVAVHEALKVPAVPLHAVRARRLARQAVEQLVIETSGACGLSIVSHLEAEPAHALAAYRGESAHDQHMLLTPGGISMHAEARRSVVISQTPVVSLQRWVDGLQRGLLGRPDPSGIVLEEDRDSALRLHPSAQQSTLARWRGGVMDWSWEGPTLDVLCLLCDHIADVVDRLVRFNPYLETNLVLDALREHALELRAVAVRAFGALPSTTPVRLDVLPSERRRIPTAVEGWPVSLAGARRLRHEPTWTTLRPSLLPGGVIRQGASLLLATASSLERFDVRNGRPLWTRVLPQTPGGPWLGDEQVMTAQGSALVLTTLRGGDPGPTLHEQDAADALQLQTPDGACWVIVQQSGTVTAFDARRGQLCWVQPIGAPGQWRIGLCAGHPVVASARGDLAVLSPLDGRIIQRLRVPPGTPEFHPWEGGLLLVGRGEHLTLTHLDAQLQVLQRDLRFFIQGPIDVRRDGRMAIAGVDRRGLVLGRCARVDSLHEGGELDVAVMQLDPRGVREIGLRRLPTAWIVVAAEQVWSIPDDARTPAWTITADHLGESELRLADADHCAGIVTLVGPQGAHLLSAADGRLISRIEAQGDALAWLGVDARGDVVVIEQQGRTRVRLRGLRAAGFLAPVG